MVTVMLLAVARCQPIQKLWHPEIMGTCLDLRIVYGYMTLPNIANDVALLVLPLPIVWSLKLGPQQKLAVMSVFLVGVM